MEHEGENVWGGTKRLTPKIAGVKSMAQTSCALPGFTRRLGQCCLYAVGSLAWGSRTAVGPSDSPSRRPLALHRISTNACCQLQWKHKYVLPVAIKPHIQARGEAGRDETDTILINKKQEEDEVTRCSCSSRTICPKRFFEGCQCG